MAKNSITDYSKTASLNTDIQSVDIDEGCLPSGINNAIRELMADLADMNDGTVSLTSPSFAAASLTGDLSFGDNDKAVFGAGSDLEIYHSGAGSFISDVGNGALHIRGTNLILQNGDGTKRFIDGNDGGAVEIHYADATNGIKLATTSTGIDVTGTVTADGLTVEGASAGTVTAATFTNTTSADGTRVQAVLQNVNSVCGVNLVSERVGANFGADFIVETSDTVDGTARKRLRVAETGDISFYEDTGTTAKLFWDASAESLGIGTSLPNNPLTVVTDSSADGINIVGRSSDDRAYMYFSENDGTTFTGSIHTIPSSNRFNFNAYTGNNITFSVDGAEKVRVDSSGNLLVGTTTSIPAGSSQNVTGIAMQSDGQLQVSADGQFASVFNRKTSDGDILEFRKDGTTVGSIGSSSNRLTIGTSDTGLIFSSLDYVRPWNPSTNSSRDNAIDLGGASDRFDDIYATNGTIQTSDQNEKQDIEALSEAEQRVAVAAKGLLRKFRWIDSVEEKGDDARIHFGIIAQDLQAAFEAEGLDAGRYAMFINSNWTDEETGEERSRMGVRYNQLLAFIIAAI